jgi:hypothetical protein
MDWNELPLNEHHQPRIHWVPRTETAGMWPSFSVYFGDLEFLEL